MVTGYVHMQYYRREYSECGRLETPLFYPYYLQKAHMDLLHFHHLTDLYGKEGFKSANFCTDQEISKCNDQTHGQI
jgi:hypothetical protein